MEGVLVRLMACDDSNYELPKHSYGNKYRVVKTPNFDNFYPSDPYSPRNRPNGLGYWLTGKSNDTEDLPLDDDILVTVDPDMTFLGNYGNYFNVKSIKEGFGVAAEYGLGDGWFKEWGQPFCDGKCNKVGTSTTVAEPAGAFSYGAPYIVTASDARNHAAAWVNLTEEMRKTKPGWMIDMYSAVMAHRVLGIHMDVRATMLSAPYDIEPWDTVHWNVPPDRAGVWVAHYCQKYKLGGLSGFEWFKHTYRELDIRKCNKANNFPLPNGTDMASWFQGRDGALVRSRDDDKAERQKVDRSRNVWMLEHTFDVARRAIATYYEEFC